MHPSMLLRAAKAAVLVSTLVPGGLAQEVNPATAQEQRNFVDQEKEAEKVPPRLRSWEVPETVVTAREGRFLREEDRIGPYGQPRWTAHRRFPSTRVYVAPPGQFEFESTGRVARDAAPASAELDSLLRRQPQDFRAHARRVGAELREQRPGARVRDLRESHGEVLGADMAIRHEERELHRALEDALRQRREPRLAAVIGPAEGVEELLAPLP